ncbi:MAG TPA: carbon starvation CstA 5TM domain-containing protein, partial [Thermoleophilaceae bacterium]|nr:carbon starvation CstA 5TM domain-containing protein [Thermoleophilaceae bacterium]
WTGATDPLGGINQLFPLFGIANQLLAAVALTVGTTILIKSGRLKWAWVTAVPLAWDAVVTLTASYQKVFSDNPKLGFFAQRDAYQTAIDDGEVLAPAQNVGDMEQIVTNSTVDGVLAAFFAILVIVIIADAMRVWIGIIRGRRPLETTEVPAEPSRLFAPAGLIATPSEREEMAKAGSGSGRFRREEHEPVEAGR